MPAYVKAGRLIRLFAWIAVIGLAALIMLTIEALGVYGASSAHSISWGELARFAVLLVVILGWAIFQFILGSALKQQKKWARTAGIVWAALHIPGFPLGTLIGGYVLWCLVEGWKPVSHPQPAVQTPQMQSVQAVATPQSPMQTVVQAPPPASAASSAFEDSCRRECVLKLVACGGPTALGREGYFCENCAAFVVSQFDVGAGLGTDPCIYCGSQPTRRTAGGVCVCRSCAVKGLEATRWWYSHREG